MTVIGKYRAVFLDRDGTINEEVGYLDSLEKLKLLAPSFAAIRRINESGMKAVVITNQSGVAKGYFTEDLVRRAHRAIQEMLREKGANIDRFYYCPHHPTDGEGDYVKACECRKPEAGMLIRASREMDIDLPRSYVVGDTAKDVETARKVGAKGILVKTGYGQQSIASGLEAASVTPDYIAEDILDAVAWIMKDQER